MRIFVLFLLIPALVFAGKKEEKINIRIKHVFSNIPVRLDSTTYYNDLKQDLVITKLKYYLSHIGLYQEPSETIQSMIYLVDEEKPETKSIALPIDKNKVYQGLEFMVGVDSAFQVSGAQDGALDPIHGMFWTWNTGYIFMKLEGKSSFSTAVGNNLEYHLGGYKHPHNQIRKIILPFKTPIKGADLIKTKFDLVVDWSEFFKNPNPIDFSVFPTATEPSNAAFVVNNYVDMFLLKPSE